MLLAVENPQPLPEASLTPPVIAPAVPPLGPKKINVKYYLDPFVGLLAKMGTAIVLKTLFVVHYTMRMLTVAQVVFHHLVHKPAFNPHESAFKEKINRFEADILSLQGHMRDLEVRFSQQHEITRDLKELQQLHHAITNALQQLDYFGSALEKRVHPLLIQEQIARLKDSYQNLDQQMNLYLASKASTIADQLYAIMHTFSKSGIVMPDEVNRQLIDTWTCLDKVLRARNSHLDLKQETCEKLVKLRAHIQALKQNISGQPSGLAEPLGLRNIGNSCYIDSVLQVLLCVNKICQEFARPLSNEDKNYAKKLEIQQEVLRLMEGKQLIPGSEKYTQMELILFLLKGPSLHRLRNAIFKSSLHYEFDLDRLDDQFDAGVIMDFFIDHFLPNCKFKWQKHAETEEFPGLDFRGYTEELSTLQVPLRSIEKFQNVQGLIQCVVHKHFEDAGDRTFDPIDKDFIGVNDPEKAAIVVTDPEKAALSQQMSPKKVDKYIESYQFKKLPSILILQFKRFANDLSKIDLPVKLPENGEIDLTRYYEAPEGEPKQARYKIKGYVVHNGTLDMGHYVASVEINGKYYYCDDALFKPYHEISREEFFNRQDAYLMVLERLPDESTEANVPSESGVSVI